MTESNVVIKDIYTKIINVSPKGNWLFTIITTSEDKIGYGEASHSGDDLVCAKIIENRIKPMLIGKSLKSINDLFLQLINNTSFRAGRLEMTAISSVNQALWDAFAKTKNISICDILGGKLTDKVELYANINRSLFDRSPASFAKNAKLAVEDGFEFIKISPFDNCNSFSGDRKKFISNINLAFDRISAVKSTIGNSVDLAIDCHNKFNIADAISIGKKLKEYDIRWFEDPVSMFDMKGLAQVRRKVDIPIATGETEHSLEIIRQMLELEATDIIMPDIKHCGGVAKFLKICALAQSYNILVSPHSPSGPISSAFSAQIVATIENFDVMEFAWGEIEDRGNLLNPRENIKHNYFYIPDGPGIGCELFPYSRED